MAEDLIGSTEMQWITVEDPTGNIAYAQEVTRRVIAQNLFWAFAYNVAGISLAITGVLNPILAAAAMVFSSLSVIANSSRLNRWRKA